MWPFKKDSKKATQSKTEAEAAMEQVNAAAEEALNAASDAIDEAAQAAKPKKRWAKNVLVGVGIGVGAGAVAGGAYLGYRALKTVGVDAPVVEEAAGEAAAVAAEAVANLFR